MRSRTLFVPTLIVAAALAACAPSADVEELAGALSTAPPRPPPPTAGYLCDRRFPVRSTSGGTGGTISTGVAYLPYCATGDVTRLGRAGANIRRLVFAQHGRGGKAAMYYEQFTGIAADLAARGELAAGETFIITPQFLQNEDIADNNLEPLMPGLFSWTSADWAMGDESDGPYEGLVHASSYAILERILTAARSAMPNLEEVIFTGQSAGGQLTQRFAALNQHPFPAAIRVRYLPANGFTYMYLDTMRPLESDTPGEYHFVNNALFPVPAYMPDAVCQTQGACAGWNDYGYGLANRPTGHYAAGLTPAAIEAQYVDREVIYLASQNDVRHRDQCECAVQLTGRFRRERALAYVQHMNTASHRLQVIPDVDHGNPLYYHPCAQAQLFDLPHLCAPILEDHEDGHDFEGDARSIVAGNLDFDTAVEIVVLERWTGGSRIRVYDDVNSGFAQLAAIGDDWPSHVFATDLALGNLDADSRREIVVSRGVVFGDDPVWVAFDDAAAGFAPIASGGADWPAPRVASAVATGNADGAGRDEIALTRFDDEGSRLWVYAYMPNAWMPRLVVGAGDAGARPTDVAMGDIDGDGEAEIAVSLAAPSGPRYVVRDGAAGLFAVMLEGGQEWDAASSGTAIALGDWDNDGRAELAVGRSGSDSYHLRMLDYIDGAFFPLIHAGQEWGPDVVVQGLAIGDMELRRSGYNTADELAVAVLTPSGPRVQVFDVWGEDGSWGIEPIHRAGIDWPSSASSTAVAFGDIDGEGGAELLYGVSGVEEGFRWRIVAGP